MSHYQVCQGDKSFFQMQDHTQADKLSKIQKDLDETKIILHQVCVCGGGGWWGSCRGRGGGPQDHTVILHQMFVCVPAVCVCQCVGLPLVMDVPIVQAWIFRVCLILSLSFSCFPDN